VRAVASELEAMPDVTVLSRSTAFGYQDHNLVTVTQRLTDHLPVSTRTGTRERLWKIRAKRARHRRARAAAGVRQQRSAGRDARVGDLVLRHRFAVLPGRRAVIFTNNDDGYRAALDLKIHGADVTVVDPRSKSTGALPQRAAASGVAIVNQAVVVEARGKWRVRGVTVARYANGRVGERIADLGCDLVGMSGGWNPVLHLFAQSGGKALWQDDKACFIPGTGVQPECSAGARAVRSSCRGARGRHCGRPLCGAHGRVRGTCDAALASERREGATTVAALAGRHPETASRGPKRFVDFQNDVAASDILLAAREGYHSVEHVKRYTAMGFGTDQGSSATSTGWRFSRRRSARRFRKPARRRSARTTRRSPSARLRDASSATFSIRCARPASTLARGAWRGIRGRRQLEASVVFPENGEDLHAAVKRECLAVRAASAFSTLRRWARSTSRGRTPRRCSTGCTPIRGASSKSASAATA
jgi:sarcosine oxidase subunit alpha